MKGSNRSMKTFVSIVSVVFFLLTLCMQPVMAQQVLSDNKKKAVDDATTTAKQEKRFEAQSAEETTSESDNKKWLLYGGGIAVGIGVAAALAGGGGGGDSAPACEEPLVGPSVGGNDWAGMLDLNSRGSQPVTAIVTHCGNRVLIQTTSTLEYGQAFEGIIGGSGHMELTDQARGKTWTTLKGPASSTSIHIYDYVNNFHDLDELTLTRTLAQ